jgi:hypothetical protein
MKSNYFKKPFSIVGPYIKDGNRNVCFTIVCEDQIAQKIVDKLNDRGTESFNARQKIDNILIDDIIVLKTRGWGYLTGLVKLTSEQAIREQNKLMDFVVEKLRK